MFLIVFLPPQKRRRLLWFLNDRVLSLGAVVLSDLGQALEKRLSEQSHRLSCQVRHRMLHRAFIERLSASLRGEHARL